MTERLDISLPGLKARHNAESRFRWYGIAAIMLSLAFLALMIVAIGVRGMGALTQTRIGLGIPASAQGSPKQIIRASLDARFPQVHTRAEKRQLYRLVSVAADQEMRQQLAKIKDKAGARRVLLTASDNVDLHVKAHGKPGVAHISNRQKQWLATLKASGQLRQDFNVAFFTHGDSREPEMAGILGALMGSILSLTVCFIVSFPIGVLAAVYLEEYARKGWLSRLIEVNINNLAAVPSIVFGLLGLSVFLNVLHMPRSSPLVGGLVLALMTLPTIIIAARASLRAVPPSIREAATGLGASKTRTTFDHVVPLSMPGMLTGAIIGMARALGETAPLLMIGMVAFVVDIPKNITAAATSLPVQVFLWADSPERAFQERTAAAIMVLLVFLVLMNLVAIEMRRRLERRW